MGAPVNAKLIILFNHEFGQNVPRLRDLYKDRFEGIRYLMPFGEAGQSGVIPVYANATAFSAHIAQAYGAFKEDGVSHYVFAADDLILHPKLDRTNILSELRLTPDSGYIKNLASIEDAFYLWTYNGGVKRSFKSRFDYLRQLPPVDVALQRIKAHGLRAPKISIKSLRAWNAPSWKDVLKTPFYLSEWALSMAKPFPYPLVFGYADFFVVPAAAMPLFARLCGLFGAMNLFAEIAIPTALALSVARINTELRMGDVFQRKSARPAEGQTWSGMELWTPKAVKAFEDSLGLSLSKLAATFPDKRLYVHPIKLSKWS